MPKKLSKEKVLESFNNIHGKIYNYSKFVYTNVNTKGVIICQIHGE